MGATWWLFNYTKMEYLKVSVRIDEVESALTHYYLRENKGDHISFAADDREPCWPEDLEIYRDVTEETIGALVRYGQLRDDSGVGYRSLAYMGSSRCDNLGGYLPHQWITAERLPFFLGNLLSHGGDQSRLDNTADRYMNDLQSFVEDAIEKGNRPAIVEVIKRIAHFCAFFDDEVESALQRWFFQRFRTRDPKVFEMGDVLCILCRFPKKLSHDPGIRFTLHSATEHDELWTVSRAIDVTWGLVSLRLSPRPEISWVEGRNRLPEEKDVTNTEVCSALECLRDIAKESHSSDRTLGGLGMEVIDLQPDSQTRISDIRHAVQKAFKKAVDEVGLKQLKLFR